jgi:hypothetical protein
VCPISTVQTLLEHDSSNHFHLDPTLTSAHAAVWYLHSDSILTTASLRAHFQSGCKSYLLRPETHFYRKLLDSSSIQTSLYFEFNTHFHLGYLFFTISIQTFFHLDSDSHLHLCAVLTFMIDLRSIFTQRPIEHRIPRFPLDTTLTLTSTSYYIPSNLALIPSSM